MGECASRRNNKALAHRRPVRYLHRQGESIYRHFAKLKQYSFELNNSLVSIIAISPDPATIPIFRESTRPLGHFRHALPISYGQRWLVVRGVKCGWYKYLVNPAETTMNKTTTATSQNPPLIDAMENLIEVSGEGGQANIEQFNRTVARATCLSECLGAALAARTRNESR
jgi:hypothetical protein